MEHEQTANNEETAIKMPKWVKIIFLFYAVIFLLLTILDGIRLFYSVTDTSNDILMIVIEANAPVSGLIPLTILILSFVTVVLQVMYGIGIYKLKRWTLPIALLFSSSTVLIGLLSLLNINPEQTAEFSGLLISVLFMGLIFCLSFKYWNSFTGSARRLIIQLPLFLALLPFFLFATLNQIFTDDPTIHDTDLILEHIEVSQQSNNAHYFLPNIENLSEQKKQDYKTVLSHSIDLENGHTLHNAEISDQLHRVKYLTDAFIEASSKQVYQCPTLTNDYSIEAEFCGFGAIRNLAELTSVRAAVEADTGNTDQALKTAYDIIRMGSLIANAEQPTLIEYLTGIAVMGIGLNSIERILNGTSSSTPETLVKTIDGLEKHKVNSGAYISSILREYIAMKDTSKPFEQYSNYFYHHNKTVNDRAALYRKHIELANMGCDANLTEKEKEIDQFVVDARLAPSSWPIISPNLLGKILNSVVFASMHRAFEKGCETNQQNELIQELLKEKLLMITESELLHEDF